MIKDTSKLTEDELKKANEKILMRNQKILVLKMQLQQSKDSFKDMEEKYTVVSKTNAELQE